MTTSVKEFKSYDAAMAAATKSHPVAVAESRVGIECEYDDSTPLYVYTIMSATKEERAHPSVNAAATIAKAISNTDEKEAAKKAEFKRPKSGTKTGRIWEIIEARMAANGGYLPNIAGVLADTAAEGISPATTRTQFNKYKRMITSK